MGTSYTKLKSKFHLESNPIKLSRKLSSIKIPANVLVNENVNYIIKKVKIAEFIQFSPFCLALSSHRKYFVSIIPLIFFLSFLT